MVDVYRGAHNKFYPGLINSRREMERNNTDCLKFIKIFQHAHGFFQFIDAPGIRKYVKHTIKGVAQADAAILMVATKDSQFEEASFDKTPIDE